MKITKTLNIVAILFLIANVGVAIFIALNNSSIILHWDFLGQVTSHGRQQLIFVLPVVSCLVYAILRRYAKEPYKMNHVGSILKTERNTELLRNYLVAVSVGSAALLLYVTICSGGLLSMSPYVVYTTIGILVISYVYTRRRLERT